MLYIKDCSCSLVSYWHYRVSEPFWGGLQHLVHHSAQRIGASRSPGSLTRIKFYFLKCINNRLFIRTVHIVCKQFIFFCFNTCSLKWQVFGCVQLLNIGAFVPEGWWWCTAHGSVTTHLTLPEFDGWLYLKTFFPLSHLSLVACRWKQRTLMRRAGPAWIKGVYNCFYNCFYNCKRTWGQQRKLCKTHCLGQFFLVKSMIFFHFRIHFFGVYNCIF